MIKATKTKVKPTLQKQGGDFKTAPQQNSEGLLDERPNVAWWPVLIDSKSSVTDAR